MREVGTLTGLRGYAAIWVLLLHFTWQFPVDNWAMSIVRQGGAGLTIFFVLSGFILAHVYAERFQQSLTHRDYWHYLGARIARVYPLHLLTLLAYLAIIWLGVIGDQGNDTPYTFLLNLGLLHAWGFTNTLSWNQPSWSISTELFAYLLFPFLIAFIMRCGRHAQLLALLAMAWAVWSAPYAHLVHGLAGHLGLDMTQVQFAYGISLMQWLFVFCAGAAAQPLAKRLLDLVPGRWLWDGLLLLGIAALTYACFHPSDGRLTVLGAALVVIGLYSDGGLGRLVAGNRMAIFFGEISYSLYLTHIIVMCCIRAAATAPVPLAIEFTIAVAIAACVHYGFERPARLGLRALMARRKSPAAEDIPAAPAST